uniref:Uncharacterized protein n=1 Tax=uncultured marine virus TaxID=186617 RepID=A0A0F7L7N2_9VIRU|nr:hypothetical protein [uncultured marine virus]
MCGCESGVVPATIFFPALLAIFLPADRPLFATILAAADSFRIVIFVSASPWAFPPVFLTACTAGATSVGFPINPLLIRYF